MRTLLQQTLVAAATLIFTASAYAGIGTASANDAHLAGDAADAFAYKDSWNPQQGPNGNTSGFLTPFSSYGTGSWSLLGKMDNGDKSETWGYLKFTYDDTAGPGGIWTVKNLSMNQSITIDLVMAIHAGNQGGAWLFDNQQILPGQTLNGDWLINWTVGNNTLTTGNGKGGHTPNNPDFSNMTIFGRNKIITQVPEPETYAMLLGGLAILSAVARRRSRAV
jgi:hypothetical protein